MKTQNNIQTKNKSRVLFPTFRKYFYTELTIISVFILSLIGSALIIGSITSFIRVSHGLSYYPPDVGLGAVYVLMIEYVGYGIAFILWLAAQFFRFKNSGQKTYKILFILVLITIIAAHVAGSIMLAVLQINLISDADNNLRF